MTCLIVKPTPLKRVAVTIIVNWTWESFFRVSNPTSSGGGFWENALDRTHGGGCCPIPITQSCQENNAHIGKNVRIAIFGKLVHFGESRWQKWHSSLSNLWRTRDIHYKETMKEPLSTAKEPVLPAAAIPAVRQAASQGWTRFWSIYTNRQHLVSAHTVYTEFVECCALFTCYADSSLSFILYCYSPVGDSLNDATAGTGTSTSDWIQLVVGEGGVVDWVFPGWRGEYKQTKTG